MLAFFKGSHAFDWDLEEREPESLDSAAVPTNFSLASQPRPFIEAWGIYEALRRLGFQADEIFILHSPNIVHGANILHVVLRTQGRQFIIAVDRVEAKEEEVHKTWAQICKAISSGQESENALNELYRSTTIGGSPRMFVQFASDLYEQGFTLPALCS